MKLNNQQSEKERMTRNEEAGKMSQRRVQEKRAKVLAFGFQLGEEQPVWNVGQESKHPSDPSLGKRSKRAGDGLEGALNGRQMAGKWQRPAESRHDEPRARDTRCTARLGRSLAAVGRDFSLRERTRPLQLPKCQWQKGVEAKISSLS